MGTLSIILDRMGARCERLDLLRSGTTHRLPIRLRVVAWGTVAISRLKGQ